MGTRVWVVNGLEISPVLKVWIVVSVSSAVQHRTGGDAVLL